MIHGRVGGFLAGIVALSLGSICNEREAHATPPGTPPGGGSWSTTSSTPVEVYANTANYTAGSSAVDKGGQVQTNAHLVVLFWGDYWTQSAAAEGARAAISSSISTLTSGVYFSLLSQYSGVGTPTFDGAWTVGGSSPTGSCQPAAGGSPVDNMVQGQLSQGLIPGHSTGTPNMVYVVITPPNTDVQDSCHYNLNGVGYAWMPLHTADGTPQNTSAPLVSETTADITHEVVESITDYNPETNPAWLMSPANGETEICDTCGQYGVLDGVAVRAYWSDAQKACAVPFPGPPTVTGVSPGGGPFTGGNSVTVLGTGFDIYGNTSVTIGGLAATPVGAPCPDGTGTCCESTTACTVTVPASQTAFTCTEASPTQSAAVQATANGMPSSSNVQYGYNEDAECIGASCYSVVYDSPGVYDAAGQCVYVGYPCGNGVIDGSGQCVGVGSACAGGIVSNIGACVAVNSGCIINGDAPGVWSAGGQCWPQTITCPAGEAPAGPVGQEYCASTTPVSGGGQSGGGKGCLGKGCAAQQ